MLNWKLIACLCGATLFLPLFAQHVRSDAGGPAVSKNPSSTNYSSDGERVFKHNCNRCHDAPRSFPPQISGTLIRHMRVRASLSKKDERSILKFLNP